MLNDIKRLVQTEIDNALKAFGQKVKDETQKQSGSGAKSSKQTTDDKKEQLETEQKITEEQQQQHSEQTQINEAAKEAVEKSEQEAANTQEINRNLKEAQPAANGLGQGFSQAAQEAYAAAQASQKLAMELQSAVMAISSITALGTSVSSMFDNFAKGEMTVGKFVGSLTGILIAGAGVFRILHKLAGTGGLLNTFATTASGPLAAALNKIGIAGTAAGAGLSSVLVPMLAIVGAIAAVVVAVK